MKKLLQGLSVLGVVLGFLFVIGTIAEKSENEKYQELKESSTDNLNKVKKKSSEVKEKFEEKIVEVKLKE